MAYTRGISEEEERERGKKAIETITAQQKPWIEHKFKGRYVCVVCGEFIRENKGDIRERHEKRTIKLGRDGQDTFWVFRHKECRPKKKEDKK